MKNELQKWCHKHNIKIVDTSKRVSKYTTNYYYFKYDDYNRVQDSVHAELDTLVVLEIPQQDLEKIHNFEQQVFNNINEHGHYNLFEILMEQKEKEKYLRNKYPAVDNAYKNYSLMLKLAESGEL
jgi:hypothetical protein